MLGGNKGGNVRPTSEGRLFGGPARLRAGMAVNPAAEEIRERLETRRALPQEHLTVRPSRCASGAAPTA